MAVMKSFDEFNTKIKRWVNRFPAAAEKAFKEIGPILITDVKQKSLSGQILGVRTGRLRRSIRAIYGSQPKPSLQFGTDVYYGAIWFKRGRDFLTPSIPRNMNTVLTIIKTHIEREYEKASTV